MASPKPHAWRVLDVIENHIAPLRKSIESCLACGTVRSRPTAKFCDECGPAHGSRGAAGYMKIDLDVLAWGSLILRLGAQKAFDEVLTSAALRHQVVLHLLDPEIRRGHDGKFARRILAIHLSRAGPYPCRCTGQCSHSCRRAKRFVSPEPNIDTSFSHIEKQWHHGELSGGVGASACAGLSADECRCQRR